MVATSCFSFIFLHFMIEALKFKPRFTTDVLTKRSGSLSEPGSPFFYSDLKLLMDLTSSLFYWLENACSA